MTARPTSLGRRLLLAALAFIAVAMVIAAIAIGFVLHRFVQGQIDQRLDTQITFLASQLRAANDGTLSLGGSADGPPFDRPRHGWYWQVEGPRNVLRSESLEGETLSVPDRPAPRPPPRKKRNERRPTPADGAGPEDEALHFRTLQTSLPNGTLATIVAAAPRDAVWRPLSEAMTTLGLSLAALAVALIVAMFLQVRLGLRPLERLRRAVADVRAGHAVRVPADQPAEVLPLVTELNALLTQNSESLDRARRHVANLAHGLKTPLSTLTLALASKNDDPQLQQLAAQMQRQIRHHLSRARAAALDGPARVRTDIAPRLTDIADALGRIHATKNMHFTLDDSVRCAVACEPQDFDEMAGNLLENAFVWSRGSVSVSADLADHAAVAIRVDDDGPGIADADAQRLLQAGARLDESVPGYGFGLAITRELAELYGGALALGCAPLGGLRAVLTLPLAALPMSSKPSVRA
jgi:signal transduction histidine kinase